jgi:hypothetical protein
MACNCGSYGLWLLVMVLVNYDYIMALVVRFEIEFELYIISCGQI